MAVERRERIARPGAVEGRWSPQTFPVEVAMPEKSVRRTTKRSAAAAKGPSEISPDVFVGSWKDAIEFHGARFCVLDEPPEDMPPATHIAIYREGTRRADVRNLEKLARAMISDHAKGEPVLVFCGHGVRRSPLGGLWYLRRSEGLSLDEAYERVHAVRAKAEHPRSWVGNVSELERA